MSANQHYEKILLSKQDLAHLYRQFVLASQAKIKHHLPVSDSHDPLRVEVENIITDHLAEAFEMAKLAFIVDGRDLGDDEVSIRDILSLQPSEEVVPFDTQLNHKLRSIIQQVEKETTEVTRLRRELPQQARDAYESLVSTTDHEVTAIISELADSIPVVKQRIPTVEETVPNLTEIVGELQESVRSLYELKTTLPLHQAQLDSLNQTMQFLEDNYRRQQAEARLMK